MTVPDRNELDLLHDHICQALGSPVRIQIMYALNDQPMNVNALAELLSLPQATTSRHLAVLRQSNLVDSTREGTLVTYRLSDPRIIQVVDTMRMMLRDGLARQSSFLSADGLLPGEPAEPTLADSL